MCNLRQSLLLWVESLVSAKKSTFQTLRNTAIVYFQIDLLHNGFLMDFVRTRVINVLHKGLMWSYKVFQVTEVTRFVQCMHEKWGTHLLLGQHACPVRAWLGGVIS